MLACSFLLALAAPSSDVFYSVPVEELDVLPGHVVPSYEGGPPWEGWIQDETRFPWATLEGGGEILFVPAGEAVDFSAPSRDLGTLVVRAGAARELAGALFLPQSSGAGAVRVPFRVPASAATASEREFQLGAARHYQWLLRRRLPGGAWFRHRYDELSAALGPDALPAVDENGWMFRQDFRDPSDALGLFSGGRALYENLQLERGLPASPDAEQTIALDTLEGITVRALDWGPRLAPGETKLDALAALIPADQHALFFPSFPAFVTALDEAGRLGEFGLTAFESRSSDARTRLRTERQLGLELSALARTFGPLVVESVALTGSDPYLRTGSDLALLFRARTPEAVHGYIAARQQAARGAQVSGEVAGIAYRGVANPTRSVSSYLATVGDTVVVANSLVQLERVARVAVGSAPALAAAGEYRFFRQRYPLGEEGESALVVLSDDAIRRWCSPRWRIACARIARAAAELAEQHAEHFMELADLAGGSGAVPRDLGVAADFPALGALRLTEDGIHSPGYGTLDSMIPVSELPLERVTEREAALYRTWREGYERAWSNFFDPIGARLSVTPAKTVVDLTVMPLILGTEYSGLRDLTKGPGLEPGSGDPHPEALVHFVMGLNPEWEPLRSVGSILGSAGEQLGVDPLSWLGTWLAVYADEGPFWDDLLDAEDVQEALEALQDDVNSVPLAVAIAVRNPLKLALFLTGLRTFAEGTAPGMTDWKERMVGERRFVEISSPGMGEEFSLFYATTPTALILSLNEPTLLRAMEREERRRAGEPGRETSWEGSHAVLQLTGRGLEILEVAFEGEVADTLRRGSWRNLPILNEWKRLHPELDPVALHERTFRELLACPGGGAYRWNDEWSTMESTVFGHPGAPLPGLRRPPAWNDVAAVGFALTFEEDGLRVRAELARK